MNFVLRLFVPLGLIQPRFPYRTHMISLFWAKDGLALAGLLAILLVLGGCGTPREESQDSASPALCALPNVEASGRLDKTPPQVASDLLSRFPDVPTVASAAHSDLALAPRGGFFNASTTRSSLLPNRRFVASLRHGSDVIVAYEHGGGPHVHVVLYRAGDAGTYHAFANVVSDAKGYCETAARLFANPRDPALWFSRIDW